MQLNVNTSSLFEKRKKSKNRTIFLLLVLVTFFASHIHAQGKMQIFDGAKVKCPLGSKTEESHAKHDFSVSQKKTTDIAHKEKTAEFIVTYGPIMESNEEAKAAFQFALDIWATEIVSSVPIRVYVEHFFFLESGLAVAGPDYFVADFEGALEPATSYPAALANSLAGKILDPSQPYEFSVNFNLLDNFYYGLDGNTPFGQFDFATVALHEIGHGLGFTAESSFNIFEDTGLLLSRRNLPSIFSKFLVNSNNLRASDLAEGSVELGSLFTSGDLCIDGHNAVAALAGTRPKVFAPNEYAFGASISHWDENIFPPGDSNSLMTPGTFGSESNMNIGDITRGLFKDMGWALNDSSLFPISVSEDVAPFEVNQGENIEKTVVIKNISNQELMYNVVLSTNPSELPFIFSNAENVSLLPGEEKTVTIGLNTSDVASDLYIVDIKVSTNISKIEVRRSLRIGVLDEVATAVLDTVDVIEEELNVNTKTFSNSFRINNTGTKILEYTVTVANSSTPFMTLNDTEGVVFRDDFAEVGYTITNDNLPEGIHTANILITSNDVDTPSLLIPVKLVVRDLPKPSIALNIDEINLSITLEELEEPEGFFPVAGIVELKISNVGELPLEFQIQNRTNLVRIRESTTTRIPQLGVEVVQPGESLSRSIEISLGFGAIDDIITSEIVIMNNDPINPELKIPLNISLPKKRGGLVAENRNFRDIESSFEGLSFGGVEAGSSRTQLFEFRNTGLAPVTIENIVFSSDSTAEVLSWSTPSSGNIVGIGEVLSVTVRYFNRSRRSGAGTAELFINSDAATPNSFFLGVANLRSSGLVVAKDHVFRILNLNSTVDVSKPVYEETIEITNVENVAVDYSVLLTNTSNIVSVSATEGRLAPDEKTIVTVTLDGTGLQAGTYKNEILVKINDQETPEATIVTQLEVLDQKGRFTSKPVLDFGEIEGNFASGSIELKNESSVAIEIDKVYLDQKYANSNLAVRLNRNDFSEENFVLPPLESIFLDVSFIPNTVGALTGNIRIRSNAAPSDLVIPLVGDVSTDLVPKILGFELRDVQTNRVLETYLEDSTVDLANYDAVTLSALAGVITPSSVVFGYGDNAEFRSDNRAPFALGGDVDGGLRAFNFELGEQTITATPFSEFNGRGEAFGATSITLNFIDSSLPTITSFVLIDTTTDTELKTIEDGETIDLNVFETNAFTIRATAASTLTKMSFDHNGNRRFDLVAPYSLGGDFNGNYRATVFEPGTHVLTAVPFSTDDNQKTIRGNPRTISFDIIGKPQSKQSLVNNFVAFTVTPNPVTSVATFRLATPESDKLSIRLTNLMGQELDSTNRIHIDTEGRGTLQIEDLQSGYYFLSIHELSSGLVYKSKILKK